MNIRRLFWSCVLPIILGIAFQSPALASEQPHFDPVWDALQGPDQTPSASLWLNNLQGDIDARKLRCPPTAAAGLDGDKATRAFHLRRDPADKDAAILYLQDPVASTFVVITRDAQGCTSIYQGGRGHPFSQRYYFSPFPNVLLPAADPGADIYVLIQDERLLRPWLRIASEPEFKTQNILVWMLLAAICAVLATVLATMYSFAVHSRTVTAYMVYVSAFLWWIVEEFGMNAAWFSGLFHPANFVFIQCVSVALVVLAIGWTMLEFLALRGSARIIIGLGQVISAASFLGAIWWPVGYRAGSMILAANAAVTMVFLMRHIRDADLPTRLFTAGFTAAMIGGGIQSLSVALDLGAVFKFAVYSYAIGGFVQAMFWMVAITTRLRQERNQLVRWRREELEEQITQATSGLLEKTRLAEDATRVKSDFLAAASHDLRQPTHALGLLIARLGQLPIEGEIRQLHESLEASARAIQDLLDDLMDYSILEANTKKIELRPTSVGAILDNLQGTLAPLAAEKGLLLKVRPSMHAVHSDPAMLRRMIQNLALNAIRYTNTGTVLITCRAVDAGKNVKIEVWDSGIGIEASQHQHIFREFYQVGNAARDRHKGIGLGLSMVQRSAQLLGHEITLRSHPGCGSRFTIVASKASAAAPVQLEPPAEFLETMNFTGLQVLLVEDDDLSRIALAALLVSWGCRVHAACSGAQALATLESHGLPDIILSDYRLADAKSGIEVISDLRRAAGQHIAACLLSGDLDKNLLEQAKANNLTLLHKPVRPAKLRSLIRRLITPDLLLKEA